METDCGVLSATSCPVPAMENDYSQFYALCFCAVLLSSGLSLGVFWQGAYVLHDCDCAAEVSWWSAAGGLQINEAKTETISFSSQRKQPKHCATNSAEKISKRIQP